MLSGAALKAYCTLLYKAAGSGTATRPDFGWTDFSGLPPRTWARAIVALRDAGMISVYQDGRANGFIIEQGAHDFEPGAWILPVDRNVLDCEGLELRAWLSLLAFADFTSGKSWARIMHVSACAGCERARFYQALATLKANGFYRRLRPREWKLDLEPRRGWVPVDTLNSAFGFAIHRRTHAKKATVSGGHMPNERQLTGQKSDRTHAKKATGLMPKERHVSCTRSSPLSNPYPGAFAPCADGVIFNG